MSEAFEGGLMKALSSKFGGVRKTRGATLADRLAIEHAEGKSIDGRSLRRTGRTEQFAARIKQETKDAIYGYAKDNDILIGEVLERAMAALLRDAGRR